MEKKYVLTEERRVIHAWYGREITLYKIVAVKGFEVKALQNIRVFVGDEPRLKKKIVAKHIKPGDSGGWIESETNLSQLGDAWVDKGAVVFDKAIIKDNAWVGGEKTAIAGRVIVADNSIVYSDDRDANMAHCTNVAGDIKIIGYSKITSSLAGEGIVRNQLINKPTEVKLKTPSKTRVKFECEVGDKRISREYML